MAELKGMPTRITTPLEPGKYWDGQTMECSGEDGCGSRAFHIFWLDRQDHPHYQCVMCGTPYCGTWDPDKPCVRPEPTGTQFWTVAVVNSNRAFGGPEEGGWWYNTWEPVEELDDGSPVKHEVFYEESEAVLAAARVAEMLDKVGANKGRFPPGSMASTGWFTAMVFEGEAKSGNDYKPFE